MSMFKRKNCLEIWTPREKKISINGESFIMHFLSREDFINIFLAFFQEYVSSIRETGIKEILNGNKLSLDKAHRLFLSASDSLGEILKVSIPDFKDWNTIKPADQLRIFDQIWEYNDVPGMFDCFFVNKARIQDLIINIGTKTKKNTPGLS